MAQKISNLPVGAKVKDNLSKYNGKPVIWKIADKNHSGYPSNTVTLISDKICLLYTSPSPRDISGSRMPSSA